MARRAHRGRRVAGFTLVEILVAFAILALAFGAVMQAMSGGLRILSVTEAHAAASRIAESRLAEVIGTGSLEPETRQGTQDRFRWRVNVRPYENDLVPETGSLPPLYLITATVSWGESRSVSLSTVKFGQRPND